MSFNSFQDASVYNAIVSQSQLIVFQFLLGCFLVFGGEKNDTSLQHFQFLLGCFFYFEIRLYKFPNFQFLLGCFLFFRYWAQKSSGTFNSFQDASTNDAKIRGQRKIPLSIPSRMLLDFVNSLCGTSLASFNSFQDASKRLTFSSS